MYIFILDEVIMARTDVYITMNKYAVEGRCCYGRLLKERRAAGRRGSKAGEGQGSP